MSWIHAKPLKIFKSREGRDKLWILKRNDGFYEFRVERYVEDDPYTGPYWMNEDISGLYGSLEEAERAAIASVPWLRAMKAEKAGDN